MDEMEDLLVDAKAKKRSILAEKVSGENIYKALIFFDKLYEKMSEIERRQFYEKLLGEVNIYEERDGCYAFAGRTQADSGKIQR